MMVLEIDDGELDAIRRGVGATEKIGMDAGRAALRKTIRWASTRVRRAVSTAANVPQKAIKNRLKVRMPSGRQLSGALWIGIDPINPVYANARETKSGVRAAGGRSWDGAFIARGKGGTGLRVFRRATKERLPLESIRISVDAEVRAALGSGLFEGIQSFFLRTFEHELRFRMERAGA
jgi:hypothetical protein